MDQPVTRSSSLSKGRLLICLIAVYLTGMCITGDVAIQPITYLLYDIFPDDPSFVISLGITGMAFISAPTGFIAGYLCDRVDKKIVLLVGFALFTVCGIFGGAVENAYYFTAMRIGATGIAWGFVNTSALAIIADLFTDEDAHARQVGFFTAVQSVMGVIMGAVAGILAVNGWTYVFYTYFMAVPILILVLFFVPSFPPAKVVREAEAEGGEAEVAKSSWWVSLIPLTLQVFVVSIIFFTLQFFISMFIGDTGVGDSVFAGTCASLNTLGCMVGGLTFGFLYSKFKLRLIPFALCALGACLVLEFFLQDAICIAVTVALAGFFWMLFMSFFFVRCTEITPESKVATSTAIVAIGLNIGGGLSSFVLMGLIDMTGMTAVGLWPVYGVVCIVIAVITGIYYATLRGKQTSTTPASE